MRAMRPSPDDGHRPEQRRDDRRLGQWMSTGGTLPERRRAWRARERKRLRRLSEAAELAALLVREGNCAIPGVGWDEAEILHARASNSVAADRAAEVVLRLCVNCPVVELCGQWAVVDQYTGLAAGRSWSWGVAANRAPLTAPVRERLHVV